MAVTIKPLIAPKQAEITAVVQYTAPASVKTIIDKMTATNTTGAAAAITVYLVTAAGSAGTANTIIAAQSVAAGTCYTCPEIVGHVLNQGDSIATLAGTVSSITIRASGREVS